MLIKIYTPTELEHSASQQQQPRTCCWPCEPICCLHRANKLNCFCFCLLSPQTTLSSNKHTHTQMYLRLAQTEPLAADTELPAASVASDCYVTPTNSPPPTLAGVFAVGASSEPLDSSAKLAASLRNSPLGVAFVDSPRLSAGCLLLTPTGASGFCPLLATPPGGASCKCASFGYFSLAQHEPSNSQLAAEQLLQSAHLATHAQPNSSRAPVAGRHWALAGGVVIVALALVSLLGALFARASMRFASSYKSATAAATAQSSLSANKLRHHSNAINLFAANSACQARDRLDPLIISSNIVASSASASPSAHLDFVSTGAKSSANCATNDYKSPSQLYMGHALQAAPHSAASSAASFTGYFVADSMSPTAHLSANDTMGNKPVALLSALFSPTKWFARRAKAGATSCTSSSSSAATDDSMASVRQSILKSATSSTTTNQLYAAQLAASTLRQQQPMRLATNNGYASTLLHAHHLNQPNSQHLAATSTNSSTSYASSSAYYEEIDTSASGNQPTKLNAPMPCARHQTGATVAYNVASQQHQHQQQQQLLRDSHHQHQTHQPIQTANIDNNTQLHQIQLLQQQQHQLSLYNKRNLC